MPFFLLPRLARFALISSACLLQPLLQVQAAPIAPFLPAAPLAAVVDPAVLEVIAERIPLEPQFRLPMDTFRLSSAFGPRVHPIRGRAHTHSGADMAAPRGTPVHSVAAGTVVAVRNAAKGYGRHIVVEHAAGYSSWYAHLDKVDSSITVGSLLTAGQRIGTVGSSGSATGPHLHLEIRLDDTPMEPLALLHNGAPPSRSVVGISPAWRANAAPP